MSPANKPDLTEFRDLIQELETAANRPPAPRAPQAFKHTLRRQLLAQAAAQPQRLSRQAVGRLWQFAGTAVALAALAITLIYFAATLSNPATTTGPGQDSVSVPTRSDVPDGGSEQVSIQFGEGLTVERYQVEERATDLQLTLGWQARGVTNLAAYVGAVQLRDDSDQLVSQLDQPLVDPEVEARPDMGGNTPFVLNLPQDLADGRYDVVLAIYNRQTGERLPVTSTDASMVTDNGTAVTLTDWAAVNKPAEVAAVVPFDRIDGLELFTEPGVGALPFPQKNMALVLYDASASDVQVVNDEAWITIEVRHQLADNTVAEFWIRVADYNRILDFANHLNTQNSLTLLNDGPDRVWLVAASQAARTSLSDPVHLEVTLGYELISEPEAQLRLWAVSPAWDSVTINGRVPTTALADEITVTKGSDEVTFTVSGNRNELRQVLDSSQFFLQGKLTWVVASENGPQLQTLAQPTFPDALIDLNQLAAMHYEPDLTYRHNQVWVVKAVQEARDTASGTVRFTITVRYDIKTPEEASLKLFYAAPDWENQNSNGRVPIDGMSDYIPLSQGQGSQTITFTSTPAEMAAIVGTETPVLMAQIGVLTETGNGEQVAPLNTITFDDVRFDLTSSNELTFTAP